MNTYDIKFPKGDTFTFKVSLKDKTQSIDSAYFTVREYANQDVLLQKKLNQGITQIDEGLYRIQIESFDTNFLDIGVRYIFDLTFKCETVVKTILYGGLTLLPKLSEGEVETTLDRLEREISEKQAKLVSGKNIKTINQESILGKGNLAIGTIDLGTQTCNISFYRNLNRLMERGICNLAFFNTEGDLDPSREVGEPGYYQAFLSEDKQLYIKNATSLYRYTEPSSGRIKIEEVINTNKYKEIVLNDEQNATLIADIPTITFTPTQISDALENIDRDLVIYAYIPSWTNYEYPFIYLNKKYSIKRTNGKVAFVSYEGNFVNINSKKVYIVYLMVDVNQNQVYCRLEENANYSN